MQRLVQGTRLKQQGEVPFMAADVGGTHARLALAGRRPGHPDHVDLLQYRTYRCAEHRGLDEILADFLRCADAPVRRAVIASAGHALPNGEVVSRNLPWPLPLPRLRAELGLQDLHLINDFAAVAHAAPRIALEQSRRLAGPDRLPHGPILVLGPGTGLGAALVLPQDGRPRVLSSEAGQSALTASTPLELAVLGHLLREHGHVSREHALSGPGLRNLYRALCALDDRVPELDQPQQISSAGLDGRDPLAVRALELFCSLLGSTAADLALAFGAQGVYLAGGILPRIHPFLASSRFADRFLDKGPMAAALRDIPVRLVEHGQLGVLGAARWLLDQADA